ncbi:TATA-binding protein-associated factor 172, partial [Geodia barretti]
MFRNLFNPSWEVRHGAATALREVIRYHGDTAGLTVLLNPDMYSEANQKWLEDASIRLLCVFALDRFADFVSDQVVAPVRATCAQCLGMCVRGMCEGVVGRVVSVLQCLGEQQQWEVRHASLMAVQHLLAARTDLCATLLPLLSPSILRGLRDVDDDVRAVAASSLLPVANQLVTVLPSKIPQLLTILWDSLVDLDDLSASTSSILGLLCSLLNQNPQLYAGETEEAQRLSQLAPRLWPFLSHTNRRVRLSCLRVLLSLLESGQRKNRGGGR